MTAVLILAFFCYLGLFAWNARTGYLDTLAERTGLEIVAFALSPVTSASDFIVGKWNKYLALVDVAEENQRLHASLQTAERLMTMANEDRAELERLRKLFQLHPLRQMHGFAARILSMRFGPYSVLNTFTIDKGFADGATVGMPVVAPAGVVGKVLRSAPHAATVLPVTDPNFKLAVISQESRTPGIVCGVSGSNSQLKMIYVAQTAKIVEGELLITAGTDGIFPKGFPVAVITTVEPGHETLFLQIYAEVLVQVSHLEEIILLDAKNTTPLILPVQPAIITQPLSLEP